MSQLNRRQFLRRSLSATAASYAALSSSSYLMPSALGANDEIRIGVAGIRGRGNGHINHFSTLPGVKIVALCDPDTEVLQQRVEGYKKKSGATDVKGYTDVRDILDRKDVDALVIAAPNHWHSLMTVWACQAGNCLLYNLTLPTN